MDETKALCFMDEKRKICPCCMETMIVKREITLDGLGDCIMAIAEPGMICDPCGLPVAREESAGALEKILITLDIWANNRPIPFKPPYAVETVDASTPEDDLEPTPEEQEALERSAKANENLNRALEEYRVIREAVLKAREEARAAGVEVDDTPIPEGHEIGEDSAR